MMRMTMRVMPGIVLGLLSAWLPAQTAALKAVDLPSGSRVVVDGKLNERIWSQAPSSAPLQWLETRKKANSPAQTRFKVVRDANNVYFGITCQEPQMDKLSAAPLDRDGPVYERDCVELFLSPDGNPATYYQFMISAGNTIADFYFIEHGNTTIGQYSAPVESAVFKGDTYWTLEVRIPLHSFFHTPSIAFSDTWVVNVARERQASAPSVELTSWAPLRAAFHEPARFWRIGNMPRKSPRYDLSLNGLQATVESAKAEGGWIGKLTIPASATAAMAGEYRVSVHQGEKVLVANQMVRIDAGSGSIALGGVSFPSLGKAMYDIVVSRPGGEVAAAVMYEIRLDYAPLRIELDEPFYGNAIFPGQTVEKIRGRITLSVPEQVLSTCQVRMTLDGSADNAATLNLQGRVARFEIDAADLKEGEHVLEATVVQNDQPIAQQALVLRKLPPAPSACVYIDAHRRLVVNGKPVFVRGWYGDSVYMVSQAIRNRYGNRPNSQFVNMWEASIGMEAERLDPKERSSGNVKKDIEPSAKVYAEMKKRIDAARSDSSKWIYYLADEPECRGLSSVYLKHQYDFIKKHDPYRPVMIITRAPEQFTACADILNPHPYLSPMVNSRGVRSMKSPKAIRDQIRTVLAAGNGRIPAWLTPQSFSYGFQDPFAVDPTFAEYRCMIWDAIANGATGFTPFMYCSQFASPDLRIGNDFIYESIARVEDLLLDPQKPAEVKVTAAEDGVDAWCKRVDGKVLLIAVNLLDREVTATIEIPELAGVTELYGFREATAVQMESGRLKLSFAPYQVHLLSNPKMDEGLKSVETVQQEIGEATAALKKPGNILFGRGREIEWTTSDTYISSQALYTLTDGICDSIGWANWGKRQLPAWMEMQFPAFVPKFSQIRVHSSTIADMDVLIWKAGAWKTLAEVRNNRDDVISVDLTAPERTVKIKLLISKLRSGSMAEVYEIELFE